MKYFHFLDILPLTHRVQFSKFLGVIFHSKSRVPNVNHSNSSDFPFIKSKVSILKRRMDIFRVAIFSLPFPVKLSLFTCFKRDSIPRNLESNRKQELQ